MKLSRERFEKARRFVERCARDLDRRLFEFIFEDGSAKAVLDELAHYQNGDGGFGHAIEPDFWLRASSPMATSVGLQYCVAVDAGAEQPLVQAAIDYLVATYDGEGEYWPDTFLDVNDEPHAPWWHKEEIAPPDEAHWPNPSAELVGYLHRWASLVPPDVLESVTDRAKRNLEFPAELSGTTSDFYNAMVWERSSQSLPQPLRGKAIEHIRRVFAQSNPLTKERLGEVHIFKLAESPASILSQSYPDNVDALLEIELHRQADDGGWWPTWQWGQYEEAWEISKETWAGKVTVECLRTLKEFGLID